MMDFLSLNDGILYRDGCAHKLWSLPHLKLSVVFLHKLNYLTAWRIHLFNSWQITANKNYTIEDYMGGSIVMSQKYLMLKSVHLRWYQQSYLLESTEFIWIEEELESLFREGNKWTNTGDWQSSRIGFIKGLWAPDWNLVKILFAMILILMIQSGDNFAHGTIAQLSCQSCDLIRLTFFN